MKKTILLIILLIIPLVSAEWDWETYTNEDTSCRTVGSIYVCGMSITDFRCARLFNLFNDSWYKDLKLIRVWDNHPKEGQPAGVYFLSNIIHIYDGCRNPDTLIHELAHLDNKNIKHDSFFWLSYYRIKYGR